ncbi:MAG: hypothetical protein RL318_2033, partial [Fibrobacterota bacterium]
GKRLFTLSEPDNPEGLGLSDGQATNLPLESSRRNVVQLLETALLRALLRAGERVDLGSRFVALGSRALSGDRLAIDGVELHLRAGATQGEWTLWMHPTRRVVDARPLGLSVAERKGRSCTLWFALDGHSCEGAQPKLSDKGVQVQLGRHARLLPPNAPVLILLGEEQPDLQPRQLIEGARRWLSLDTVRETGFQFSTTPLALEDSGLTRLALEFPEAYALDLKDNPIELGEHYRKALTGSLSSREAETPATFHLMDGKDQDRTTQLAQHLNQKAQAWKTGLQFATEPIGDSIGISLSVQGKTAIHLDPNSPLVTQPNSPRALGQMGAVFLECTQLAGGKPWRLGGSALRPTLGLSHALLHGRQNHLAAVLFDASGNPIGGTVLPLRLAELQNADFARGLRRRLPELPEGTLVLLAEDLDASHEFLEELRPNLAAARILRQSLPWALDAGTYDWLAPGEAVGDESHLYACLPHPGGGARMLGVEVVQGELTPAEILSTSLALEHAWAPGRVEPRLSPGPLEWARGLLFQRARFEAFLAT